MIDSALLARFGPGIRAIRPELAIESLSLNDEGLANEVVVVNGEFVFRFARASDWARRALASELAILDLVRPRLPVPEPFYAGEDSAAYRFLPGEALTRDLLDELEPAARRGVARQLGECLRALHETPLEGVEATSAPMSMEAWLETRRQVEEKVYPHMLRHQREWAARLYDGLLSGPDGLAYEPRLIHGDLGPYHILYDRAAGRLSGLIDFGVAGAGDPATDLGLLLQVYGGRFVALALEAYPEARAWLGRARLYAQALELEWALKGLRTGDAGWFVAHLGGARDL